MTCLGCAQQSCGGCPSAAIARSSEQRRQLSPAPAMEPGLGVIIPDAPNSTWSMAEALTDWRNWALAIIAGYLLYRLFTGASQAQKGRKRRKYSREITAAKREWERKRAQIEERYA